MFDRFFYETLLSKGEKIHISGHLDNVAGEYEWLKWLTYYSFHEREVIDEINNKKVKDLTEIEKRKLFKYEEYGRIARIIEKNIKSESYDKSFMDVVDYVNNHDINKLISCKLSPLELESLDKQVDAYINGDTSCLKVNLDVNEEEYMKLSIYDAYILYRVSVYKRAKGIQKINDMCSSIDERNLVMSQKSSYYANNSKPCI